MGKTKEEREKKREEKRKQRDEERAKKREEKNKDNDSKDDKKEKDPKPYEVRKDPVVFPNTPFILKLNVEELKTLKMSTPNDTTTWNIVKVGHGKDNDLHEITTFDNQKVIKVIYPKNSYKPSASPIGGIGIYCSPVTTFPSAKNIKLSYQLYFDKTFDPQLGGKLPGIYMGPPGASGGRHSNDNASCRIMWRTFANQYIKAEMEELNNKKIKIEMPSKDEMKKLKEQAMIDGEIECEAYVYNSDDQDESYSQIPGFVPNEKFGDSLWRGVMKFKKNQWNKIDIDVVMNTYTNGKANKDGVLSITINGNNFRYDKMKWTENKCNIEGITFDTFFGGGSNIYASPVDTCIYFNDFTVTHENI